MDLFNLIRASNPTKVKTGTRPRVAHEVPLLTVTASRVIEMEDPAAATDSSGVPSTIERSPLDFANENSLQQSTGGNGPEDQGQEAVAPEVPPPKNVTTSGVAPEAGQAEEIAATGPYMIKESRKRGNDRVDTNAPPKVLRRDHTHIHVLQQMLPNLPREWPLPEIQNRRIPLLPPWSGHPKAFIGRSEQVAMGSQLRLRFEQEAKLLKKSVAQVARQDKRIQARENEIKNLETLLEAETDMKKTTEGKREEKLKATFKEFKQYEDNRVEQRCAKMDARLDALSIDFDEELYPYMLTAIVDVVSSRIAKGMNEGLKYGVEHGKANLSVEAIEAYEPEAKAKYIAALHALKDLKYPIVDQLKSLKDAHMDVIMASLHLESDPRYDAPQWIRELHPSSSQLKVPVYPEVHDHADPWACKEEILLPGAIAADVSRAKKKKKCRVVCRTHEVGSAHHARSDGVLVSVPPVSPQGLIILLADAATQTKTSEDETSPRVCTASVLCAPWKSLRTHPTSWVYVMKMDSESAAVRVATRLCGRPSIGIFGL
nr:hypothetical protein [Tanacetum cinerariifolium]